MGAQNVETVAFGRNCGKGFCSGGSACVLRVRAQRIFGAVCEKTSFKIQELPPRLDVLKFVRLVISRDNTPNRSRTGHTPPRIDVPNDSLLFADGTGSRKEFGIRHTKGRLRGQPNGSFEKKGEAGIGAGYRVLIHY